MNYRFTFGINLSIFLISLIFAALFSLPLKLLLDTNYETQSDLDKNSVVASASRKHFNFIDSRRLRVCPNYEYVYLVGSLFFSSYDRNCTYLESPRRKGNRRVVANGSKMTSFKENGRSIMTRLLEEGRRGSKVNQMKSISVAGHILAVMLIGSVIAALVEVIRIRFSKVKEEPTNGHAFSRRSSLADLTQRRHTRRETMHAQKSIEIQGMHRSPFRLLGARPPPLLRRSSFPAQCVTLPVTVVGGTPVIRPARQTSVDSDEESNTLIADFRRRIRLIRRR